MNILIRQAHLSDLVYVYKICLKTGFNGTDATELLSDEYIIGHFFAAPFIIFETDACFIVEKDRLFLGYIVGTSFTGEYNKWLNTKWLPVLRKRYTLAMRPKSDFEKLLINLINNDSVLPDFLVKYPSQLHIDLMPEIQGIGFGRKLIHTFIMRMKEKKSTGVHFAVGAQNIKAIGFYKKIGFKEIKAIGDVIFMGMIF
ncbi:MAG: GNAT family N-acetyltransferase [Spirochaetales bacterium]|nr:GNAT family N-acetyltransferase [Spirochaetales bacterium]